jgi:CXXX repeat peptide maturase
MSNQIQNLILPISEDAVSFCYDERSYSSSEFISIDRLLEISGYAKKNNLSLTILGGSTPLPKNFIEVLNGIDYTLFLPSTYPELSHADVVVIDGYVEMKLFSEIAKNGKYSIVLKVSKEALSYISSFIKKIKGHFYRVSLILEDLISWSDEELDLYKKILGECEENYKDSFNPKDFSELNFITDRLFLQEMNNCQAGIKHLTVDYSGNFHICPAFMKSGKHPSVGSINSGVDIKSSQLLELEYAPVCLNCDSYQCRRCLYLNKTGTNEINIPTRQQCVASHHERKTSKRLADFLIEKYGDRINLKEINSIDYLDPFDVMDRVTDEIENRAMQIYKDEKRESFINSRPDIGIDLTKLSNDELLNVRELINNEIKFRN